MSGKDFAGRVCFVTGAGRGIGRAIALTLARAGAAVAAFDRDAEAVRGTVAAIERDSGRALAIVHDLRDLDAIAGAFDRAEALGPVDVLKHDEISFGSLSF